MNGTEDPGLLATTYDHTFHGVMILAGLVGCFAGFRLFKAMVAVLGGFCGALAGAYFGYQFTEDPILWVAGGAIIGGILGIILGFFFFSLAVAFAGSLFGVILLLPWLGNIEDLWMQLGAIFLSGCIFGIFAVFAMELGIRLGTAYMGAFGLVYGAWFFAGGPGIHQLFAEYESVIEVMAAQPMVALAVIVIGLIGFAFQSRSSAAK
jgi:hypothetical protein